MSVRKELRTNDSPLSVSRPATSPLRACKPTTATRKILLGHGVRAGETVLGVDPGLTCTGWGVVREVGNKFVYVESGRIRTKPITPMVERISEIFDALQLIVREYNVDRGAVEAGFVGKGAMSALKLGQARAAAALALHQSGIPVHDLSPREVKLAVVGKGSASKEQVGYMVGQLLGLQFDPGEADISDALGIAITAGYLARRLARGVPA